VLIALAATGCGGPAPDGQGPGELPVARGGQPGASKDTTEAAALADTAPVPAPLAAPVYAAPRALWVVRHDLADPKHLADAMDWAAATGFTDLLVQVRGRGDAYYRSDLVPRAEDLRGGDPARDPLAEAIALGRARGLRVHAWINVSLAWSGPRSPRSPEHVARAHRDWFVWIQTGGQAPRNSFDLRKRELDAMEIEGHFLIPGHPAADAHLEAVVRELVGRYPLLDGIHFDYARLPRAVKSLDPESRAAFRARYGVDPGGLSAQRFAAGDTLAIAWYRFHEEGVTVLVARLAAAARAAHPGITVSAAVHPNPAAARRERAQDWDRWLADGTIDVAVPMCYAADQAVARADLRMARAATSGRLWAGLGLYNKSLAEALAGAALARELGYEGVALFSHTAAREKGPRAKTAIAAALAGFAAASGVAR
jgi:uncharacterized lipoprotein YddW (UPF0748 family)